MNPAREAAQAMRLLRAILTSSEGCVTMAALRAPRQLQGLTHFARTASYMRLILCFVHLPKLSSRRMVRPVNEFPISMTEQVRIREG
jgi:hypothetical protein